jgi:hypothetical protein
LHVYIGPAARLYKLEHISFTLQVALTTLEKAPTQAYVHPINLYTSSFIFFSLRPWLVVVMVLYTGTGAGSLLASIPYSTQRRPTKTTPPMTTIRTGRDARHYADAVNAQIRNDTLRIRELDENMNLPYH